MTSEEARGWSEANTESVWNQSELTNENENEKKKKKIKENEACAERYGLQNKLARLRFSLCTQHYLQVDLHGQHSILMHMQRHV